MKYPRITNLDWSKVRNKNTKAYLLEAITELEKANVRLELHNATRIQLKDEGGALTSGYFDIEPDVPVLAVAAKRPVSKWLRLFTHEFNHVRQWLQQTKAWTDTYQKINGKQADFVFWDWISHKKNHPVEDVIQAMRLIRTCEEECEDMVGDDILCYDLPINTSKYAGASVAYLYTYAWAIMRRQWYKKPPFEQPEILKVTEKMACRAAMYDGPIDFDAMPIDLINLFDKYCG